MILLNFRKCDSYQIRWILSNCLLWFFVGVFYAQPIEFNFRNYVTGNGFEANQYNMFIQQASNGYVWISSSRKGAYRFNGINFEQFPKGDTVNLNIQSNFYEDLHGDIWFSSVEQLHCYRQRWNDIVSMKIKNGKGGENAFPFPFYLNKKKSELWIGTGNRIAVLNTLQPKEPPRLITSDTTKVRRFTVDTSSNGEVKRIYGSYWVIDKGFEIWTKSDDGQWTSEQIIHTDSSQNFTLPHISRILVENDSLLWLLSNKGVGVYHRIKKQIIKNLEHPFFSNIDCNDGVFINDNILLIATKNQGLLQIDRNTKTYIPKENENKTEHQLNNCFGLVVDDQNRLWTGQKFKGIHFSQEKKLPFTNPMAKLQGDLPRIAFIVEDDQAKFWIATYSSGIFVFNNSGEQLHHYLFGNNSLPIQNLQHFSIDNNGTPWCVGRRYIYRLKNDKWERLISSEDYQLFSLFHHSAGMKYLSTNRGLKEMSVDRGAVHIKNNSGFDNLYSTSIIHLHETQKGYTIVPQVGSKFSIYKLVNGRQKLLKDISISADFFSFSESNSGDTLWIGTSKGLLMVDLENNFKDTLLHHTNIELSKNPVFSALSDSLGGLWISSSKGLVYSKDAEFFKFSKEDGLVSDIFTNYAALKASDGKMWFGTDDGLVVFNPYQIQPYAETPKVHIEELWIDNQLETEGEYIDLREKIDLGYKVNTVRLKVVAVGFHLPELNTLRYRLSHGDQNWTEIENGGFIELKNFAADKMNLEIVALNANGVISETKHLRIHIKTPIWKKMWFWAICVLILIGLIYLWLRARLEQRLKNQQRIFNERSRIANDLHDDIGSTLSNIHILATLAKQKITDSSPARSIIYRIGEEAQLSAESLDDIIWSINAQNDPLDRVFARMRRYASEVFEFGGIDGKMKFPKDVTHLRLDMKKRRQLYLFFKEAINNLSKYANCSKACIEIKYQRNHLYLDITDNGCGFDVEKEQSRGNGLRTMRKRITNLEGSLEIISQPGHGTSIKADFPIT